MKSININQTYQRGDYMAVVKSSPTYIGFNVSIYAKHSRTGEMQLINRKFIKGQVTATKKALAWIEHQKYLN
jgi:hypothetical protein